MKLKILAPFITAFIFTFYFSSFNDKPPKTSGALIALQTWTAERAYPDSDIPADKFYSEFEKVRLQRLEKKHSEQNEWLAIGPNNIGGRTISIVFNPQNPGTIFAGSASGGLWKSYTDGVGENAWQYVPTGYPVHGISSIAIAPTDSNIMYIGTGEVYNYKQALGGVTFRTTRGSYGIGILKSTDAGVTWQKSLDWSYNQERGVWVIRINPLNPNTVWAGTTEGTYRSYDAGSSWSLVDPTIMVNDLIINSTDTSKILISCGNLQSEGHGIYRSTDAGESWGKIISGVPQTFGGKALFSEFAGDPNILYLSIGNSSESSNSATWLCKSTDGGATWQIVSTFNYSSYQGWFAHLVVVNQYDAEKILCAGVDVYKSENGGQNFIQKSYWYLWYFGRPAAGGPEGPFNYSHADHHCYATHPALPDVVYFGNDGGIFRTTDFGESFEGLNGGYQTTQFYNKVSVSITDPFLAIGGMQDNATAIYDGQASWIRVLGGDGGNTAINQLDNNILYGSSQYMNISRSTNRGENWSWFGVTQTGSSGFIGPYAVSVYDPEKIYIGKTVVHKSTNAGADWYATNNGVPLSQDPPVSIAISPSDDNVVYVGIPPGSDRSKIMKTANGGDTWTDVTKNLPDRYAMDIAFDPDNQNRVFVAFSGFGTSHLFTTESGGVLWRDIGTGLPDVPANAVIVDPDYPQIIYVGNDLGVFASVDSGANWEEFSLGLPDAVMIKTLGIVSATRTIKAATHGNGVYETMLLDPPTKLNRADIKPKRFSLSQNYPNPFNPTTVLSAEIAYPADFVLKVYNNSGEEIIELFSGRLSTGTHSFNFDAGKRASGIYYAVLRGNGTQLIRKMLLLK